MSTTHRNTEEERRVHLAALLANERQGSVLEQRIDIEMRLLLTQYDELEEQRAQVLKEEGQGGKLSSAKARSMKNLLALERTIQAKLEFAGDLLGIEPTVTAACISTVSLHYVACGESSFEPSYPLLRDYFTGKNPLLFPSLGFLTHEEVFQLLDMAHGVKCDE